MHGELNVLCRIRLVQNINDFNKKLELTLTGVCSPRNILDDIFKLRIILVFTEACQ